MLGWLKKAFAGGGEAAGAPAKGETVEYKGYSITPTPISEGGQYRVSGIIEKEGQPELKHTFIRSDLVSGKDEACSFTLVKAKLIIDQLGDGLFKE